jgi:ATP-binding cassette subfamily A (ABC1) protein 3
MLTDFFDGKNVVVLIQLKGVPAKQIAEEVDRMVKEIGLEAKRKALANTLSGGMKRKLSIGIALIGGSKVIRFKFHCINS